MVRVPTASTSTLSDDDTSSQMQDQAIILRDSSSSGSGGSSTSFIGGFNSNDDDNVVADNNNNNDDAAHKLYQQIRFDQEFESAISSSTSVESASASSAAYLLWTSVYANNKEIVLGSCAAITVFLTVLLAFIVSRRKTRTLMDKTPLVDNEVSVNVDVERLTIHV